MYKVTVKSPGRQIKLDYYSKSDALLAALSECLNVYSTLKHGDLSEQEGGRVRNDLSFTRGYLSCVLEHGIIPAKVEDPLNGITIEVLET